MLHYISEHCHYVCHIQMNYYLCVFIKVALIVQPLQCRFRFRCLRNEDTDIV